MKDDTVALFYRIMGDLQETWYENENLVSEQHENRRGIRSSQIAALVLLLIEKGIIKEEDIIKEEAK